MIPTAEATNAEQRLQGFSSKKYCGHLLAEVAVPRPLFAAILERIGQLRLACASG